MLWFAQKIAVALSIRVIQYQLNSYHMIRRKNVQTFGFNVNGSITPPVFLIKLIINQHSNIGIVLKCGQQ